MKMKLIKTNKLKIFGKKAEHSGYIANLYIDGNIVKAESSDSVLAKQLARIINREIEKSEGLRLVRSVRVGIAIEEQVGLLKTSDPNFLLALKAEFYPNIGLGMKGKFGSLELNGYTFDPGKSIIV